MISSCCRSQWSYFLNKLSDNKFKRLFQMSKGCFKSLCEQIIEVVGIDEFKSEDYVQELYNSFPKPKNNMRGSFGRTHTLICGEIKLAITSRILARSSYLDLMCNTQICALAKYLA